MAGTVVDKLLKPRHIGNRITQMKIKENEKRFKEILLATGRPEIDYVIECLEKMGFFKSPASSSKHLCKEGGLCLHSLNVYDEAMGIKAVQEQLHPGIMSRVSDESIAIAALLHDVCKADMYVRVIQQNKQIDGSWKRGHAYEINDDAFAVGHGEKSVIMLLQWGFDLYDDELLAIRWHMGAWNLPFQSIDYTKQYNQAMKVSPLVSLIANADDIATNIIEA